MSTVCCVPRNYDQFFWKEGLKKRQPLGRAKKYFGQAQGSFLVSLQVESGQLYHVTTPSFGSQPISEGKSWIPTKQIGGIQKDR